MISQPSNLRANSIESKIIPWNYVTVTKYLVCRFHWIPIYNTRQILRKSMKEDDLKLGEDRTKTSVHNEVGSDEDSIS